MFGGSPSILLRILIEPNDHTGNKVRTVILLWNLSSLKAKLGVLTKCRVSDRRGS